MIFNKGVYERAVVMNLAVIGMKVVLAVSVAVVCGLAKPELKVMVEVTAAAPKPTRQKSPAGRGSAAAAPRADNPSKLFVGGLAWETDDFSLREAFDEFGPPFALPCPFMIAAAAAAP